ncbi:ABC transporter permease subunit [Mesorhizobium xinjiangense]|uniref:ABC transporter permease subunit n=1 Tax=Mesorhizobium xinjiangense TaxID=2678685 RepID=UPI0012EDE3A9|nr:ABC transporter permease subunit [Mesorhizobium xinjiangense]
MSIESFLLPLAQSGIVELLWPVPPGWGGNLLRGLGNSVQIALGAFGMGIVIGTTGAWCKLYGNAVVKDLFEVYTTVVRAVPELVLILLLYYAGTDLVNRVLESIGYPPIDIGGLAAGIGVLGVVQGAYATEVIRGAIKSIPQGQIEAARAYGMSPFLLMRRITLPAMLPYAIPGLANLWLIATKDTALLAVVGFNELTQETRMANIIEVTNEPLQPARTWFKPHRIVLIALAVGLMAWAALTMRWDWIPDYAPLAAEGLWRTIWILIVTCILGFALAVPLGLAQAAGPRYLAAPARAFCTVIRGTPLLLQLWLLYYGLGSLFPQFPWIRGSELWPYLRQAWPYAVLSLTLSFAGYEGEVMRGAFAGVPKGQLESARAFGMSRWKVLRRIWLPQAIYRALPTLAGETVLQLKATPLIATITVVDIYAVSSRVRQDTFIIYEPLLLLALIYLIITGVIILIFRWLENRVPSRLG